MNGGAYPYIYFDLLIYNMKSSQAINLQSPQALYFQSSQGTSSHAPELSTYQAIGPDHVQLTKVNWRLKVNWKNFQEFF